MDIQYAWAMPSSRTFTIKPIQEWLGKWLHTAETWWDERPLVALDPFAGNGSITWTDDRPRQVITNDVQPDMPTGYHLDVWDFLLEMDRQAVAPHVVIWDPVYTFHQLRAVYKMRTDAKFTQAEAQRFGVWTAEKDLVRKMQPEGALFVHFGHHTNAMGLKRGYRKLALLVVAHGRAHNDTLCLVEQKEKAGA